MASESPNPAPDARVRFSGADGGSAAARPTGAEAGADEEAALGMLGLARRAGKVVMGTRAVLGSARAGRLRLALIAGDASGNARARVRGALEAADVPLAPCGTRRELGRAVGKGPVAVVGIEDARLARRVVEQLGPPPVR